MNDFLEKLKADSKEILTRAKIAYAKLVGRKVTSDGNFVTKNVEAGYEINLVPEVKAQMIKAQKIRNLVLFICIVVSSVAVGAVVVLFGVKSGQDIAMSSQDRRLAQMSDKMNSYSELSELITIQGQLEKISAIVDQKTVLSRVFGALGVMLSVGDDSVKLSELRVNLETNVISMEGQADALVDPRIDYRVLEAFKKSAALTKFDYGNYVDANGNVLPTQCIQETDAEGNALRVGDSYYAWWNLTIEGCEGAKVEATLSSAEAKYHYIGNTYVQKVRRSEISNSKPPEKIVCEKGVCKSDDIVSDNMSDPFEGIDSPTDTDEKEDDDNDDDPNALVPVRVLIWRTPQYNRWYTGGEMEASGTISGIEHFESVCYRYKGTPVDGTVRWNSTNDCMLVPNGLTISESSNGRDESDNLVLRFTASATLAEEFFMFNNKHMIAIGPMGQNVTDSFLQIGGMFTQEAQPCAEDDIECLNNKNNSGEN